MQHIHDCDQALGIGPMSVITLGQELRPLFAEPRHSRP